MCGWQTGVVTLTSTVTAPRSLSRPGLPTRPRTPSLVVTPAVVAHRGASGHRPEHTLEAYRTAIAMGADAIEIDLVPTADGVLVARHEGELSATTDVARHPGLADRRTTRVVDGRTCTGWFTEDLTLAELRTLRTRERFPDQRVANTAYDGREPVATFDEVLATVGAESARLGRSVGILVELKSVAHYDRLGLSPDEPLLADLRRHGLDHPRSTVTLMSFEPTVLRRLAPRTRLPLVQLLDVTGAPADLVAAGDPRTYRDLATPAGLAWVEQYADGVGAHRDLVLPGPSTLVRDAHRHWLTVHVWTLRADRCAGDPVADARAFLDAGVDGLITDHPDVSLRALVETA